MLFSFNILLVLQILCRYKWHACRLTCTDKFPNVPTTLRKALWGGDNCPPPPPPPSGYASEFRMVKLLLSTIWAANASLFNEQIFGREWGGGGGCVDGGWRPGGRREGEERVRDVVLFCLDFFFSISPFISLDTTLFPSRTKIHCILYLFVIVLYDKGLFFICC